MLSANQRHRRAMYTTVSPVVLIMAGLFAGQASAADQVVAAGETRAAGVVLANGDTLTNNGTITNRAGIAVDGLGDVGFILNSATGKVEAAGDWGILISGDLNNFENHGTVLTDTHGALRVDGKLGTFINTGSMTGTDDAGVEVGGVVGTFTNSGTLQSATNWTSVYFAKGVGQFSNSGTIINTGAGQAVEIDLNNGAVGIFDNSGTITAGAGKTAVDFSGNTNGVGTFTNSGTITGGHWKAVGFNSDVQKFVNTATGLIQNIGRAGASDGHGVEFNSGGKVVTFENHGIISGDTTGDGAGVGFFNNTLLDVDNFLNTGTISGSGNGVTTKGGFVSFTNSGTIVSTNFAALNTEGNVGTFINAGTISSVQGNGVWIGGDTAAFTNAGTIKSTDDNSVYLGNATGPVVNRGTIQGQGGIRFDGNGARTLTNSGTIRGENWGAIGFGGGDDVLRLQTGSKIFGAIEFEAGDDTVDVSDFAGNTLLRVFGLENLVKGDRLAYHDAANNELAVVEANGIVEGGQRSTINIATGINNILTPVLGGVLSGLSNGGIEPLGYMPSAPQTAADMAIIDPPAHSATAWATAIGGGSHDAAPVDVNSLYGALVAGTHALLAPNTTLGVLGGIGSGRVNTNNGGQIVDSVTGLAGVYGRHDAGAVAFDFSLIGGYAGNDSRREVAGPGGLETARASYSSWFISPSIGVAIPVLNTGTGEVDLVGKVSYVGGSVAGYTETGSSVNLTVGSQSIGLVDARIGLAGTFDTDAAGTTKITANAGLFAQANIGGTTVPITFLGQTQNAAVAGATDLGLYGGLGIATQVTPNVKLTAGADAQWKFNGEISGAVRAGISASF